MFDSGTTDAIFIVRQMQKMFRAKGKKLCFGFVDLEKAFDRVPRKVIRWAMHKLGVEKWLVYTVVRTVYGNSNCFEVKVDMHYYIYTGWPGGVVVGRRTHDREVVSLIRGRAATR